VKNKHAFSNGGHYYEKFDTDCAAGFPNRLCHIHVYCGAHQGYAFCHSALFEKINAIERI
jgi:hypothetical protein